MNQNLYEPPQVARSNLFREDMFGTKLMRFISKMDVNAYMKILPLSTPSVDATATPAAPMPQGGTPLQASA